MDDGRRDPLEELERPREGTDNDNEGDEEGREDGDNDVDDDDRCEWL